MKKAYETPSAEVVKFQYRDQVVAASGASTCNKVWINQGTKDEGYCVSGNSFQSWVGNQSF